MWKFSLTIKRGTQGDRQILALSPETSPRRASAGSSLAQRSVMDFVVSVWGQNLAFSPKIPPDWTQNSKGRNAACHTMGIILYVDQPYRQSTKWGALVAMGYSAECVFLKPNVLVDRRVLTNHSHVTSSACASCSSLAAYWKFAPDGFRASKLLLAL